MTTVRARPAAAVGAVAAGSALLAVRPLLWRVVTPPTLATVALCGALLVLGSAWPLPTPRRVRVDVALTVLVAGVLAFAVGRVLVGGHAPAPVTAPVLVLNGLAAVAEEAFFRRLVYGVLAPQGAATAVCGSAALFALVHVGVYGTWVLPIDLAAGLLLGWQRWATDSWAVPAGTHVVANLLTVL